MVNHSDLVKELAGDLGKTQKEVDEFIKALAGKVHEKLQNGEKVVLKDLATFETKFVPSHKSRNPRTKEEVIVPDKTAPVVKPVTAIKEAVKDVPQEVATK